jgi:hypothetical protein
MTTPLVRLDGLPLVLHTRPALEMTDEQFYEFCQLHQDGKQVFSITGGE